MLSGVGVVCFSASYAVALALEVSRLVFRSGVRGAIMIGFAAAGLVAHTAFLYHEAIRATGSPLSSQRDWYLVAAWLLVVVYLYLTCSYRRTPFGLFLLPAVLTLIGVGVWAANPEPNARGPASLAWGLLHGGSILLATVSLVVGFAAGLMYLVQAGRLKSPTRSGRLRLPSLEWLAGANSRAIVLATLFLGVGVLSGAVLVRHNPATQVRWSDPFVWSTWVALVWLIGAVAVVAFYRPARAGRKVVYLTLASFVVLAAALALGLSLRTQHGGGPRESSVTTSGTGPFFGQRTLLLRQAPAENMDLSPSERPSRSQGDSPHFAAAGVSCSATSTSPRKGDSPRCCAPADSAFDVEGRG